MSSSDVDKLNKEKSRLEDLGTKRLVEIDNHMKEVKKIEKMNLREALMKNIVPILTEGLIDVCKVAPIDPIDYLADYIFRRSNEQH
jgi:hypothetical protein